MEPLKIMVKIFERIKANGWTSMTAFPVEEEAKLILMKGLLKSFIFNHDVAKAFWGDDTEAGCGFGYRDGEGNRLEDWQYHLQQMVLEKEPLKYMAKFLGEE